MLSCLHYLLPGSDYLCGTGK
ncbi:hypothetical protein GO684_02645 [Wolbachia endosymbiont of Litomosoides brasiliensis]|nr:hypothetical protein [Wolbachia endosymbiont of Litomosoides brasiliensis]